MKNNGTAIVREIIGRNVYTFQFYRPSGLKTIDPTRVDYAFWDSLSRGRAIGYEFGGLFCKPLAEIVTSHVLGTSVLAHIVRGEGIPDDAADYTDKLLARLMARSMGQLATMLVDLYRLGDQFVVVNEDGSFSVPSPDTVTPKWDSLDYRRLVQVVIRNRFDDYEVEDEYRLDGRTLRIKWLKNVDGHQAGYVEETTFPNLIGRLPVVHFANDRSANELYGRPIYEAMLRLLSRYDDLVEKGLDGAELSGAPIPVISGLEDVSQVHEANAPVDDEEYDDVDGNTVIRDVFNFDTRSGLLLGTGAAFQFASPPVGFTEDIRNMLKLLFLLLLDHTRVGEALWGGAISSSKASAEVQMPPFYQFIEGRRLMLEGEGADEMLGTQATGGLLELLDIWLRYRKLADLQVVVAPVEIDWQDLNELESDMRLQWVSFLHSVGLITDETAVEQSGLVDDAVAEVEAATEQAAAKAPDNFGQDLAAALRLAMAQEPPSAASSPNAEAEQEQSSAPGAMMAAEQ